jgi:superfamily II DNA or RNA helicase
MARSVRLRAWQKAALELLLTNERRDFLAVATPGAGKTTFALTAARHHLAVEPHSRVIVVVPTQHLKTQWASAALAFDLHLEPQWSASNGRLPADMHGIVTTYQQVASSAQTLHELCRDAFVIFDEIHHAGDDRAWGDAIRVAFDLSSRRLALSGTPFRSDTNAIPFVHYDDEEAVADFEYGYGHALSDRGVVRPVYFPRINGEMEWTAPDGTYNSASFDDELDTVRAGQRLRTALSLDGQWLPDVLGRAHRQLKEIRTAHPAAGGLVIAMDQEHARGIARMLEHRFGVHATVATSDDPMASMRIAHFSTGSDPWIVAVRMVSEGVDIPRLRVGVFATNTTTDLFFRQAIGRLVRYTRGLGPQKAYMFIPDDARLRVKAAEIATHRRHSLRRREKDEAEILDEAMQTMTTVGEEGGDEMPSLFAPISAVALDGGNIEASPGTSEEIDLEPEDSEDEDRALTIELAPAPPLQGGLEFSGDGTTTRAARKADLRNANAEIVRELVALTGTSHAAVNGELNRRSSLGRITEATVQQLEVRLRHAEAWLSQLTGVKK